MKSNSFLRRIFFGASERRIVSRKRLTTAYVSLFLICALFISGTLSWFTSKNMSSIGSDLLKMSSSTGLSINQGESLSNKIIINDFKLSEASSVDGRNMFFPITGTPGDKFDDIDNQTAKMLFREGNAGDKNILYAYKNITIVGVTDPTNIYVKSYKVVLKDKDGKVLETFDGTTQIKDNYKDLACTEKVKDGEEGDGIYDTQVTHQECPIRIAFIDDSQDTPRVFDPTAIIQEHVDNYDAVSYINDIGAATTNRTQNQSFSDYIFSDGATPLFQISHSDSIDLAMVIWLEGTGENMDRYADGSVSVEVDLESNFSNMVPVKFVDKTSNDDGDDGKNTVTSWVGSDDCIVTMAYKDTDGATKTVVMKKLPDDVKPPTWTAMLPSEIETEISFYRFSVTDETIYNSWHTTKENPKMRKLSTTAQGWLENVFGPTELESSRVLTDATGKKTRSLVYTARCGNGYGKVDAGRADTDLKRLSPCIGFWDQTIADKGLSGSDTGGGSQGGGGSTEGDEANVEVNIEIPSSKNWVSNDLKDNGYKPYIELNDGTLYDMYISGGNYDKCTMQKQPLPIGKSITSFTLKSNSHTKRLYLSSPQIISSDYNYNYTIDNSDKIVPL